MLRPQELEIARNLPPDGCSLDDAQRYTHWLATHHYENFGVASWLLPRHLHQHFYNAYAYCRWADDLGDEIKDSRRSLQLLDAWENELHRAYAGAATHPVFTALQETVQVCDIPVQPFADLLIAFRQDQTVRRYATWESLMGYCRYSANPVGRIVLYICDYRDAERQNLSDATCTALQLANFWQDVDRDLDKGRIYIPIDVMKKYGLTAADVVKRQFDTRYVHMMKDIVSRTRSLFAAGAPLARRLAPDIRIDVELFTSAGVAVLDGIEAVSYDTLHRRPVVSRAAKARMLARAMLSRLRLVFRPAPVDDARKTTLAKRHA
jgi:squalene synthase HpnC